MPVRTRFILIPLLLAATFATAQPGVHTSSSAAGRSCASSGATSLT